MKKKLCKRYKFIQEFHQRIGTILMAEKNTASIIRGVTEERKRVLPPSDFQSVIF